MAKAHLIVESVSFQLFIPIPSCVNYNRALDSAALKEASFSFQGMSFMYFFLFSPVLGFFIRITLIFQPFYD